jgi:hypothetical protein
MTFKTPAEAAGLVVGRKYRIKESAMRGSKSTPNLGKIVTFARDDGSTLPFFTHMLPEDTCCWVDGLEPVEEPDARRPFLKGDVVKLNGTGGATDGIDAVTAYTLIEDEYNGILRFIDNTGNRRARQAKHYDLVSRPDVASVTTQPITLKVDISIPAVTLSRVGDTVSLEIVSKLTKAQVESILNIVFDNKE